MALLDNTTRDEVRKKFIREFFVALAKTADLDTNEVLQLVEDADAWLDSQITEANNAIRLAIRTKASTETKFAALAWVALRRAGIV